jgi:hypothetical protein
MHTGCERLGELMTGEPATEGRPARRAVRAIILVGVLLTAGLTLVASSTSGSLRLTVGITLLVIAATATTLQRITTPG